MTRHTDSISKINIVAVRSRNAFRSAVLLLFLFLATFGLYIYLGRATDQRQFFVLAAITGLVSLGYILAARLGMRGKAELAAWILIGGMVLSFPFPVLLLSGVGVALGIGEVIGSLLIASLTMARPNARRANLAGLIGGVGIILLDVFIPFTRIGVRVLEVFIPFAVAAGIASLSIFIYREWQNYPLRTKLTTAFVFIALITIVTLGYFFNVTNATRIKQDIGSSLIAQGEARALLIGEILGNQVEGLESFGLSKILQDRVAAANSGYTGNPTAIQSEIQRLDQAWRAADAAGNDNHPLVSRVLNEEISSELREFRSAFPENVEVFVTDGYGANVGATNRTSDYYQGDEEWWQSAYNSGEGSAYIGQPEFDQSSSTFAVIIAVPLFAHDTREVIGVLRTTLDMKSITAVLNQTNLGTGQVELYVADGMEIPSEGGDFMPGQPGALSLPADRSSYGEMTYDDLPSLVSRVPVTSLNPKLTDTIGILGWTIIVQKDREESLAPVRAQTQSITLISLLLLGFSSAIAFYASQILARPIMALTRAAEQIGAGDLNAKVSIRTEDEIGTLAGTINKMAGELGQSLSNLEKRVAERTTDLQIARHQSEKRAGDLLAIGEISRLILSEKDLETLLPLITRLVGERFGYYHVGIFLLDESGQFAVLQAANSEGGKRMLERGHRLEVGESGIVGFVAKSGNPRIALDVGLDAVYFKNPDMPNTRSEISLPLIVGGKTLGVMDVQSEKPGVFTEADAGTLTILADQVAIAIENARLFQQTQQALKESQALYSQFIREGWAALSREQTLIGYEQTLAGGRKLSRPVETDEIRAAINSGNALIVQPQDKAQKSYMVVPVKLRGQIIGTIKIQAPIENRPWSRDEINLANAVSDRLSLALENARLIQDSQRQVLKEQTITEVTSRIGTSIDMKNVLKTAVEELGRALPGSEVMFRFETNGK